MSRPEKEEGQPFRPHSTDDDDLDKAEPILAGKRGEFFAMDHRCWAKVCSLGMNAAVAYALLARGSDRHQRNTSWSVQAIETHTGVSRGRAKQGIQTLVSAGLITITVHGSHPRYEIVPWSTQVRKAKYQYLTPAQKKLLEIADGGGPNKPLTYSELRVLTALVDAGILEERDGSYQPTQPEWIWLPNEFVTGAAGETPPLELIRQSQDVMALRLAVDLYRQHNLREDGGVSREIILEKYDRFIVGKQGPYVVWGFRRGSQYVTWSELTEPHRREEKSFTEEERKRGKTPGTDFFTRLEILENVGLLEFVPHLVESTDDNAEIIHPLSRDRDDFRTLEERLAVSAHEAGRVMLTERQRIWAEGERLQLIPVPRHLVNVQVVGIARMLYRPKTRVTAAWWADMQKRGEEFVERYLDLWRSASGDLQHQGGFKGTSRVLQGSIKKSTITSADEAKSR